MLKTYTPKEMKEIKEFAYDLWSRGDYETVTVDANGIDIVNPWVNCDGRTEFSTDEEAIAYWGEDIFYGFCEKALVYMYQHQIKVTPWEVTKP